MPRPFPLPPHGPRQFIVDEFAHLVQMFRRGRIVVQEHLFEPHGAQWLRDHVSRHAVFAGDDLRAAAADIDNQQPLVLVRPGALQTQVDQARLFAAGDDFDRRSDGL
jgi:hypothetical protein